SGRYTIDRDGSYELNEDGSIESDTIRIKNPKAGTSAASGNEAVSTCPQPPTDLLGRKSLINDAIALLRDPNRRLITLAGPAGIGRTTIALNLMEKIRGDFKDGVYFCSFQDVKALDELISRINSKVANVQDAKEESLFNWLRDKNCLLILDNFEDPLEDKAANIPGFIMNLLNQAPGVKLLVTTRESMTIAGIEKIIHVDILNDADSEALIRKLADDLDLTKYIDGKDLTGLLKQLGGVPLAIVLAVPNLVLGIDVLTEELERQNLDILSQYGIDVASAIKDQSLVKSFLLSYSKIKDTNERLLFLICSLFPSGLKKLDANKILFGLKPQMFQSLIFKSLISCPKDNTYTMLAPMRAFAYGMFKRMAAENEIDISVIVRWINLCDEKSQEYYKTTHRTGKRAINELIDELPDMFRVLDYLISTSEKGTLLKILLNLVDFSSSVGITKEVMSSLEEAAKIAKASGDILGEANCIYRIGDIHFYESRNNDALNSYNSALPLYKQVDNILGEANCIRRIGDIHLRESRNNDALNSYNSA
ncbi:MAG: NB-ARC domain-containing protein, partial [Candidatus Magnetominusculus sp. LBB02]|nr:NB-ARC domain-containing protein [Candidatus Magnetominusculus sp. LBB02]